MTSAAAAPSLVCDELPAVTVPCAWNTGFSLASASSDVSARGPSSRSNTERSTLAGRNVLHFDGHDLIVEVSLRLRAQRVLMAAQGEGVGIFARDAVLAVHALRGQPHGQVDLRPILHEPGIGRGLQSAARHQRHGFAAARDHDIGAAGADAFRRHRDGLQAGTAEAVDGHAGTESGKPARRDAWRAMLLPASPSGMAQPRMTSSTSSLAAG